MNAIWFLDLSSGDKYISAIKSLISDYEKANGTFDYLRIDKLNNDYAAVDNLEQKVDDLFKNQAQKLNVDWPFFGNIPVLTRVQHQLRIVLLGDVTEIFTQQMMHLFVAKLRDEFIRGTVFSNIGNLQISGILTYDHDVHQNLPDEQALFLTQLNLLQKSSTTSLRPFNELFFMQRYAQNPEKHYQQVAQFVLFRTINTGNNGLTGDFSFNAIGVSGVFFEKDVQKHNESALLSTILLQSFGKSGGSSFVDPQAAENLVNNAELIKRNNLGYEYLLSNLKPDVSIDSDDVPKPELHPVRQMWSVKILSNYYEGFVKKLIFNLVNKWNTIATQALQHFRIKLEHKRDELLHQSDKGIGLLNELENEAYKVLSNPEHVCGLQQQALVVKNLKDKIKAEKEKFSAYANNVNPEQFRMFPVPPSLNDLYEQAENEEINDEDVLKTLESRLKTHPVLSAKLIRAILLSLSLVIVLGPLLDFIVTKRIIDLGPLVFVRPMMYVLSFLLPFMVAFFQIRYLLITIKTSQKKYHACVLHQLNKKAEESLIEMLVKVYQDLDNECEILKKKNENAIKNLTTYKMKSGLFNKNEIFQPLWETPEPKIESTGIIFDRGKSGVFDNNEILGDFPGFRVNVNTSNQPFLQFLNDYPNQSAFIRELMNKPVDAEIGALSQTDYSSPINALLVLDISGSMGAMVDNKSKIEHLRTAVKNLQYNDIKWLAFRDEVYTAEGGRTIFTKEDPIPDPGGGTGLYVALKHIGKIRASEAFDRIILISDGAPWAPDASKHAARELNTPIDAIFIGDSHDMSGLNYMKEIAQQSKGEFVFVNNLSELAININSTFTIKINQGVQVPFWEALKLGYYANCMDAAFRFAESKLAVSNLTASDLLNSCGNPKGIQFWKQCAQPNCTLRLGFSDIIYRKSYTGETPLMVLTDATHLLSGDEKTVQFAAIGEIPAIHQLLLDYSAEKELKVFDKKKTDQTSKISAGYLNGVTLIPVFPENQEKISF